MKKIISLILSVLILISSTIISPLYSIASDNTVLSAETIYSKAGDTVDIPIYIKNNSGLAAFRFLVEYDEAIIKLIGISFQEASIGYFTGTSEYYHSPYSISGFNCEKNINLNGILCILTFKINSNAENEKYPISLSYDTDDIFNIDGQTVNLEIVNGAIYVGENICNHINIKWCNESGFIVKRCTECNEELSRLQFEDLGNYVIYADYVEYTSLFNKFISGTNPPYYTQFSPATPITRAMFVAILYRMAGNPYDGANPYTTNPFSDIKENAYYYNAACWALDEGITNQTTFKPNNNVTREQTARFLYAYAESKGLLGDEAYKNVNLSRYPDYNSVHSWAVEPLQWANYNDMITGTQQGYINPQGATQRIHATRILYGFGKVCNIGNFE